VPKDPMKCTLVIGNGSLHENSNDNSVTSSTRCHINYNIIL